MVKSLHRGPYVPLCLNVLDESGSRSYGKRVLPFLLSCRVGRLSIEPRNDLTTAAPLGYGDLVGSGVRFITRKEWPYAKKKLAPFVLPDRRGHLGRCRLTPSRQLASRIIATGQGSLGFSHTRTHLRRLGISSRAGVVFCRGSGITHRVNLTRRCGYFRRGGPLCAPSRRNRLCSVVTETAHTAPGWEPGRFPTASAEAAYGAA